MKILIIYYSHTGNTTKISKEFQKNLNADICEIEPLNKITTNKIFKFVKGGMQSVLNKKIDIKNINRNIENYDIIVLGTPVWAGKPVPAMLSFLNKNKILNKKIILFYLHDGGAGKIIAKFKGEIDSSNNIIDVFEFKKVKKNLEKNINECKLYCEKIKNKI